MDPLSFYCDMYNLFCMYPRSTLCAKVGLYPKIGKWKVKNGK